MAGPAEHGSGAGRPGTPDRRAASSTWSRILRLSYWIITRFGPLVRWWVQRFGMGNVVDVVVVGRRSGRPRAVLLGLLRVDGQWYLGHPNGEVAWTRNLDAAGVATLAIRPGPPIEIRPVLLPDGPERDRAIGVTWRQHVFPGNVLYWLARRHILAVGRYYRIEGAGGPTRLEPHDRLRPQG